VAPHGATLFQIRLKLFLPRQDQPSLFNPGENSHPLHGSLAEGAHRGVGVELRLHNMDPDAAEARARTRGDVIFAGALDKGHGLREAYITDPDGYLWVVDRPTD